MDTNAILNAGVNCAKTHEGRWRIEGIQIHSNGYAEPGYDDPESGMIALGNWNSISEWDKEQNRSVTTDDTPERIVKLLEHLGVELEWEDEWIACDECGKLIRTQPNSYSWQRSYAEVDGSFICLNCVDPVEHLANLEGQDKQCNTLDHIDPADYGYVKLNEQAFENGLYGGQTSDPRVIGRELRERGVDRYLFSLDAVGQFDVRFSVYVHEDEYSDSLLQEIETEGNDPAEAMKKALKTVPAGSPSTPGNIVYSQLHSDGTATTREITPQEFVEGIR